MRLIRPALTALTIAAVGLCTSLTTTADAGELSVERVSSPDKSATRPHTLLAGHALVARTKHRKLQNGRYELVVWSGLTEIMETMPVPGADGTSSAMGSTWMRAHPYSRFSGSKDKTRLRLGRHGDLALVSATGVRLWHSDTRGSGAVRMTLHRNGRLALHKKSGKVVWRSRSGQLTMAGGMRLNAGQSLLSEWVYGIGTYQTNKLTMQRNGNLVHRCGRHIDWQTHTNVPGSSLRMYRNGHLRVVGPKGRVQWSAPIKQGRHYDYSYLMSDTMQIKSAEWSHTLWYADTDFRVC